VNASALVDGELEWGQVVETETGAAEYDPLREFDEMIGVAPTSEVEEGVGAGEDEDLVGCRERGAE
jgi:hypothetical protein